MYPLGNNIPSGYILCFNHILYIRKGSRYMMNMEKRSKRLQVLFKNGILFGNLFRLSKRKLICRLGLIQIPPIIRLSDTYKGINILSVVPFNISKHSLYTNINELKSSLNWRTKYNDSNKKTNIKFIQRIIQQSRKVI